MRPARRRLGLKEVRVLRENETVWDAAVPGFGARRQLRVPAVTREDIDAFMHTVAESGTAGLFETVRGTSKVRGGRGTATRTVGLLGGIFAYAVRRRLRTDNPVRGVLRFPDHRRER